VDPHMKSCPVMARKRFASLTPVALMLTAYLVLSLGCSPLAGSRPDALKLIQSCNTTMRSGAL